MTQGPPIEVSMVRCNQCGFMHPKLQSGEECPMESKISGVSQDDFINFTNTLKNIISSQVRKKNVNDVKKLLSQVIVKLTKEIENYSE